jgi:glycosyltransferase involved in cell wall biosynthesis
MSHRILMRVSPRTGFSDRLKQRIERNLIRACASDEGMASVAANAVPRAAPWLFRKFVLVLKAPRCDGDRVVERGVLLLKNTERLDFFRRCMSMASVLKDYTLVLEPSWSGYANPKLLAFDSYRDRPVVVMSPCRADYEFLERLNSRLRPISIGASDWVDPRVFRPLASPDKRFDAVVIARWNWVKRHHLLLRALRRIADPSYRVALVSLNVKGDQDRSAILSLIDRYDLARQVTVFEDLVPARVNEILNQAKVNVLLSRQEGSNRSLFEGFFAGVPGLAFANHIGIPLDHFTTQTGRLIAQDELPDALLYFREHWAKFDPRPWAMANIAPEVTTARLNLFLRQLARESAEPWTQDIVAKCNRPGLYYYPDAPDEPDRPDNKPDGHGFATVDDLVSRYATISARSSKANSSRTRRSSRSGAVPD